MMKCKMKICSRVGLVCRLFLKLCVFHVFFFNLSFPVSSSRVGISTGFPIQTLRSALLVGCLRVNEPILSPHLDKLITHNKEVINSLQIYNIKTVTSKFIFIKINFCRFHGGYSDSFLDYLYSKINK